MTRRSNYAIEWRIARGRVVRDFKRDIWNET